MPPNSVLGHIELQLREDFFSCFIINANAAISWTHLQFLLCYCSQARAKESQRSEVHAAMKICAFALYSRSHTLVRGRE